METQPGESKKDIEPESYNTELDALTVVHELNSEGEIKGI